MSEIEELESRIRNLSKENLAKFRLWFHEFENAQWDKQIEADFKAGKFASLIAEARKDFAEGKAREL